MTLDLQKRAQIVGMKEAGATTAEIAVQFNISERTIRDIYKKYKERGTITPKTSSGRPRKLNERDIRSLARFTKKNRTAILSDITKSAAIKVSEFTIRRRLHEQQLFARVAIKKPFLTAQHQAKRLEFALTHRNWTPEQWKQVIWTDESIFEIGKNFRQVLVWRTAYERYDNNCLTPTFKSGRTSVMIWGAFAGSQQSELVFIPKDQRTAKDFIELVYDGELLRFLGSISGGILMEDGAPVHRSKASKKWRELQSITKLEWPANSPDLNPIENIWATMKNAIQHRRIRPKNVEEMKEALKDEWQKIPADLLKKFYTSMPERLAAVIRAKGGHTRW